MPHMWVPFWHYAPRKWQPEFLLVPFTSDIHTARNGFDHCTGLSFFCLTTTILSVYFVLNKSFCSYIFCEGILLIAVISFFLFFRTPWAFQWESLRPFPEHCKLWFRYSVHHNCSRYLIKFVYLNPDMLGIWTHQCQKSWLWCYLDKSGRSRAAKLYTR